MSEVESILPRQLGFSYVFQDCDFQLNFVTLKMLFLGDEISHDYLSFFAFDKNKL